jgi:hypothetical protein
MNVDQGLILAPTNFPELGVYRLFQENTTVCRVALSSAGKVSGH